MIWRWCVSCRCWLTWLTVRGVRRLVRLCCRCILRLNRCTRRTLSVIRTWLTHVACWLRLIRWTGGWWITLLWWISLLRIRWVVGLWWSRLPVVGLIGRCWTIVCLIGRTGWRIRWLRSLWRTWRIVWRRCT